jgi:hypothetical protein
MTLLEELYTSKPVTGPNATYLGSFVVVMLIKLVSLY